MVNSPAWIPECDSQNPALLDLFISSDASNCSTMASPSLENSDHVVLSVSNDFWSNSKLDALLHRISHDFSCADWDGFSDHLRCYMRGNLLLLLVNSVNGFTLHLITG